MIAHVVLFQPRAGLSDADREAFAAAFARAIADIPQVRRARLGERLNLDRAYDRQNPQSFSHAAVFEFETPEDLRAYLDHPAHAELGRRFYQCAEAALAFDFTMFEGADGIRVFSAAGGGFPR